MKKFIIFVLLIASCASDASSCLPLPKKSYDIFELCKRVQQDGFVAGIKNHITIVIANNIKIYNSR